MSWLIKKSEYKQSIVEKVYVLLWKRKYSLEIISAVLPINARLLFTSKS